MNTVLSVFASAAFVYHFGHLLQAWECNYGLYHIDDNVFYCTTRPSSRKWPWHVAAFFQEDQKGHIITVAVCLF